MKFLKLCLVSGLMYCESVPHERESWTTSEPALPSSSSTWSNSNHDTHETNKSTNSNTEKSDEEYLTIDKRIQQMKFDTRNEITKLERERYDISINFDKYFKTSRANLDAKLRILRRKQQLEENVYNQQINKLNIELNDNINKIYITVNKD
jgi:hypothetical protein